MMMMVHFKIWSRERESPSGHERGETLSKKKARNADQDRRQTDTEQIEDAKGARQAGRTTFREQGKGRRCGPQESPGPGSERTGPAQDRRSHEQGCRAQGAQGAEEGDRGDAAAWVHQDGGAGTQRSTDRLRPDEQSG
jgi:hypothetical protein